MRSRDLALLVCLLVLGVGGYFLFRGRGEQPKRVEYHSYTGTDPIAIEMKFNPPTTDLDAVPETPIPREFLPDDLVAIGGSLANMPKGEPKPVLVHFIERRQRGNEVIEVVGNSAVEIPKGDPKKFRLLVNVPKEPGEYSLRVELGGAVSGGRNYIGRGKVIVRPK